MTGFEGENRKHQGELLRKIRSWTVKTPQNGAKKGRKSVQMTKSDLEQKK
jgi:hypothetical protein